MKYRLTILPHAKEDVRRNAEWWATITRRNRLLVGWTQSKLNKPRSGGKPSYTVTLRRSVGSHRLHISTELPRNLGVNRCDVLMPFVHSPPQPQLAHLSQREWDAAKQSLAAMVGQLRRTKLPISVKHRVQFFSK